MKNFLLGPKLIFPIFSSIPVAFGFKNYQNTQKVATLQIQVHQTQIEGLINILQSNSPGHVTL